MKKLIALIFAVCMVCSLFACSQKVELRTLELTDEMLDVSAMGKLDNIFTAEYREKLISVEPEMKEYYSEFHDYGNNNHEREDYTVLRIFGQVFADDENFYIEKTYASDQADGRICQIGVSCQVQIPNGEFTAEELKDAYMKSMEDSLTKLTGIFFLSEDPPSALNMPSDVGCSYIWTDHNYYYSYTCRYVGGEKGDNDLCRINISISTMDFIEKYHGEIEL